MCLLVNYFPVWLTFVEGRSGNDAVLTTEAVYVPLMTAVENLVCFVTEGMFILFLLFFFMSDQLSV